MHAQRSDTPPLRHVGALTADAGISQDMRFTTRRLAAALSVATLALAGCGGDSEEHGPGEAEHSDQQPGMTTPQVAGHGEEIGGSHGEAARGPGATDRHDLKLELNPSALRAGQTGEIGFKILGAGGEPVTTFEVEHTKQIHLIVVNKSLTAFHHVHPKVSGHGTWRVPLRPRAPGEYRVIADVRHEGRKLALTGDLTVEGDPRASVDGPREAEFVPQKLEAGVATTLEFRAPGRTQQYLGAAGHLVILSEGDLEYLHVHPNENELAFEASFPRAGKYVMFLEYKRGGEVRLARFEVSVG